jgi:hypothetical protein
MRRLVAVAVLLGLLVLGTWAPSAQTDAAWMRPSVTTGSVTSGVLNPVPTVACGTGSGLIAASIPISWIAPATGGNSVAPTGYHVVYSGTAGSGSLNTTAASASIPSSALAVAGTMTVTVFATYGPNWISSASLQTRTITALLSLFIIVGWTCN